eukprot:g17910.t1
MVSFRIPSWEEYADTAAELVKLRREAKLNGNFFVEPEAKLIFVVRIAVLQLLRLKQLHNGVFLKVNKPILNMLKLVQPYVTYGYPSLKTVRELIYKRGFGKVSKQRIPLSSNDIISDALGKHGIHGMEDIIHEIYTVGPNFKQVSNFLWPFKLSSPKGGFVNKRHGYCEARGGDWGNREELLGTGNSRSAALQDAVEGIAGLMQRFEELQPQIAQLPPTELQEIATPAQKLHERFENMQKKLVANGNANANPELEEAPITFHRDLAVFVNGVAKRFGITGPRGLPGAPGAGSFAPRLQAAMQAIQSGMQRFEALHSKLPNLPPQVFNPLADQAQKLHEEFLRLQQKGMQLTSGQQLTFVGDAEYQVKQAAGSTSGLGGYQGMLGSRLPTGTTGPSVPPQPMPPLGSFGAAQPPQAAAPVRGQAAWCVSALPNQMPGPVFEVTPDTDRRLSAVIDKVIRLMQEFQGMAPQLARVPQQVIAPLASMGTSLDTRFRDLQRRGTEIAGDSTRCDFCNARSVHMEHKPVEANERYVEQAKQALKAAPQGQVGQSGQGGLGSARLEDLRGGVKGIDLQMLPFFALILAVGDQYRSSQAFGLASLEEMGQATLNTAVLPQNSHEAVSEGVAPTLPATSAESPSDLAFLPPSRSGAGGDWPPRSTPDRWRNSEPEEIVVPGARQSKLAGLFDESPDTGSVDAPLSAQAGCRAWRLRHWLRRDDDSDSKSSDSDSSSSTSSGSSSSTDGGELGSFKRQRQQVQQQWNIIKGLKSNFSPPLDGPPVLPTEDQPLRNDTEDRPLPRSVSSSGLCWFESSKKYRAFAVAPGFLQQQDIEDGSFRCCLLFHIFNTSLATFAWVFQCYFPLLRPLAAQQSTAPSARSMTAKAIWPSNTGSGALSCSCEHCGQIFMLA